MRVSDERLKSFIELYKKHYGIDLSVEDARVVAGRLIALYELILQPLPHEKVTPPSEAGPARTAAEAS